VRIAAADVLEFAEALHTGWSGCVLA
jgi:hypothetical protein